jgi:hypothetical protein
MVGEIDGISGFNDVTGLGPTVGVAGASSVGATANSVGAIEALLAIPQPSSTVQISDAAREALASDRATGSLHGMAPSAAASPEAPVINATAPPPVTNPTAVNATSSSTASANASATVNAPITIDNVVNQISDTLDIGNALQGTSIDQALLAQDAATVDATTIAGADADDLLRIQDPFVTDLLLALLLQQQNQQSIVI